MKYTAFIRVAQPHFTREGPYDFLAEWSDHKGEFKVIEDCERTLFVAASFNSFCSSLLGGLNRKLVDMMEVKHAAASNINEVPVRWRKAPKIDINDGAYVQLKKTRYLTLLHVYNML